MSGTGGQRTSDDASTFVKRLGIAAPWTVRAEGDTCASRASPWRPSPRREDLVAISQERGVTAHVPCVGGNRYAAQFEAFTDANSPKSDSHRGIVEKQARSM